MDIPEPIIVIDKVRASKAGHAYHEAWAARLALELLMPSTDLLAITLEGFDAVDEAELGTGAVEIADLVRYFGHTDLAKARLVEIVQFKYSIASATIPVRAADLVKTLNKFADADAQLRTRHGDDRVEQVVRYDFATNRSIHPEPPRFHRRRFSWSQAAMLRPFAVSRKSLSASAGGMWPMGPRRRRLLNQSTQRRVSHSTASMVLQDGRR